MKKSNFCRLKTSLSRIFILQFPNTSVILSSTVLRFCCKFSMTIICYLPVSSDKPKFIAFFVFVCTTASFIAQISFFENASTRDTILKEKSGVIKQKKREGEKRKVKVGWLLCQFKSEIFAFFSCPTLGN